MVVVLSFTIASYISISVRSFLMSEKNIQQVLEIEKHAQEIQEKAKREAQEIPVKAEQEAQALIAKAKTEAQEEARKMVADAQSVDAAGDTAAELASED